MELPSLNTVRTPQTPGIIAASNDPSANLANVGRMEEAYYNDVFRPLNRELIASVDSTEIIDTAKATANKNTLASIERGKRQRTRRGITATKLDQSRNKYSETLEQGVNYDQQVNSARVKQYERNTSLREGLINKSRNIAAQATDGLSQASNMQTQRENNNRAASAQNSAARNQMIGSVASGRFDGCFYDVRGCYA